MEGKNWMKIKKINTWNEKEIMFTDVENRVYTINGDKALTFEKIFTYLHKFTEREKELIKASGFGEYKKIFDLVFDMNLFFYNHPEKREFFKQINYEKQY